MNSRGSLDLRGSSASPLPQSSISAVTPETNSLQQPQQPQTPRPQSVRAQSRRYLQQTLTKLSEDSLRIGRRLQSEAAWAPSPLPPLRQAYARPGQQRDPWEVSRNMAAELSGKPPIDFPDASASVEEDARACDVRDSMNVEAGNPAETEDALLDECNPSMPTALLAVAKVINSWEAEVRTAADVWRVGLSEQMRLKVEADERWVTLQEQLQLLQERLDQVDACTRDQKAWSEQLQEKLQSRLESTLHQVAEDRTEQIKGAVALLAGSVDEQAEAMKSHVNSLLAGTFEKTDGSQKSIGQQIKWMSDQLGDMSKREDFLRETADKWQRSCEEANSEIRQARGESQEARDEAQRLTVSVEELRAQLQKAQQALERAQHAPGCDTLRRLKELEERGNVRIDRQTGRVELVRALDFTPCSPADMGLAVEFADAGAAADIMADISEIIGVFKVPIQVDLQLLSGKGGKPDFWDSLAGAQAKFVSDQLGRKGVPQNLLSSQGAVAPKGSKTSSISFQLSQDIFPAPLPQGKGAGKGGASKSPRRK